MEDFTLLQGTDTLKDSKDILNNNMLSLRSLSGGSAFPTDNLYEGMLCYREDLKRLYQYQANGSWSDKISMNISGSSAECTGNSATATRASVATTAEACSGNSATAKTAEACTGNSATATKLAMPRKINETSFDGTRDISINVGVKTVNGNAPSDNGNVDIAGVPVGFEYISFNPNIPVGSLPLLGGTFNREAYADLWEWVQTQTGYLISETAWQSKAVSNNGNVPFYSDGDGSTTFRVPSLNCWVKGANGIEEVGSYLEAGLPNIEGTLIGGKTDATATDEQEQSGAFAFDSTVKAFSGGNGPMPLYTFDASRSNDIYGNSDTVQPESIVGLWLVKAYGSVGVIGTQEAVNIASALDQVEQKMSDYTENVAYIDSFIVESWRSDDGSSWYRKYSDGWIEQGGVTPSVNADSYTVTLNTPFTAANYHVNFITTGTEKDGSFGHCVSARTNTTFTMYDYLMNGVPVLWYACGY